MKDVIVEYDDFTEQKLWESFTAFFRHIKGYSGWNDEEIALSMNIDDFKQYVEWARKVLEMEDK